MNSLIKLGYGGSTELAADLEFSEIGCRDSREILRDYRKFAKKRKTLPFLWKIGQLSGIFP